MRLWPFNAVAAVYVAAWSIGLAAGLAFPAWKLDPWDFIAFLVYPLLVIAAIWLGIVQRRTASWRAFLPLGILLLAVPAWFGARSLGNWTRDSLFRHNLPRFTGALAPLERDTAFRFSRVSLDSMPWYLRNCCLNVTATRDSLGGFSARFVVSRGHFYLYDPSVLADTIGWMAAGWRDVQRWDTGWYDVWR